jgi:hypothetical protein
MTVIKERPILFSAPMVRAILEGRRTVTRRAVKIQPRSKADIGSYGLGQPFIRNPDVAKPNPECPYGRPGDRLWVRETWARVGNDDPGYLTFGATYPSCLPPGLENIPPASQIRWKPSIHMFRRDSRILLEITDVRVERLQDITYEQAAAEGIHRGPLREWCASDEGGNCHKYPVPAFRDLWQSVGGNWDANPWVWVVEFKRVTP